MSGENLTFPSARILSSASKCMILIININIEIQNYSNLDFFFALNTVIFRWRQLKVGNVFIHHQCSNSHQQRGFAPTFTDHRIDSPYGAAGWGSGNRRNHRHSIFVQFDSGVGVYPVGGKVEGSKRSCKKAKALQRFFPDNVGKLHPYKQLEFALLQPPSSSSSWCKVRRVSVISDEYEVRMGIDSRSRDRWS